MMNTLLLDMRQNPDGVASGYDDEEMPIPLEAVFFGEPRVRVCVVNLPGTTGSYVSLEPLAVPAPFARILLAGVRALTACPKVKPMPHQQ